MVGYNLRNLSQINPLYRCQRCSLLLRDPIQFLECGHQQCQSCSLVEQNETIRCSNCQQTASSATLRSDRGLQNDLQSLVVTCGWCNWTDVLRNYPQHLYALHPHPVCLHCQEQFSSIDQLNEHQCFTCQKILLDCPLQHFGCLEKIPRMDFDAHLRSESHQSVLAIFVHQLQSKRTSSSTLPRTTTAENEQILSLIEALVGGVEVLSSDLTRLNNEYLVEVSHLTQLGQQVRQSEEELRNKDQSIERIRLDEERIENELPSIREQVIARFATHHEGKFIWKIDNLQQKIADAESDRQTSMYSPVFYTSPTGYKLRLRLYLTGDAGARRTHLSLFLVLMRGEYDAILRFPFCYKVIFSLLDQSETKSHLVGFFQPDPTSSSFHRPRTEMNTASGLSRFVPLAVLHDANNRYIVNDTMFIEAKIDFEHLFLSSSSSSLR